MSRTASFELSAGCQQTGNRLAGLINGTRRKGQTSVVYDWLYVITYLWDIFRQTGSINLKAKYNFLCSRSTDLNDCGRRQIQALRSVSGFDLSSVHAKRRRVRREPFRSGSNQCTPAFRRVYLDARRDSSMISQEVLVLGVLSDSPRSKNYCGQCKISV